MPFWLLALWLSAGGIGSAVGFHAWRTTPKTVRNPPFRAFFGILGIFAILAALCAEVALS